MKSIHWNIPFTSVKGDSYLLWIYDEGFSGNQVRLQAGQVPFTTEENTDTDFFSPVRGGTGSISIIDPDGTIMRSLLPDNNTSRPVRLMKSVDGGQQIVWQGFLLVTPTLRATPIVRKKSACKWHRCSTRRIAYQPNSQTSAD